MHIILSDTNGYYKFIGFTDYGLYIYTRIDVRSHRPESRRRCRAGPIFWLGGLVRNFFCTGNHGFVHEISVYIAVSYRCPWNNLQPIQNLKSCKTLVVCHSLVGGIICMFLWSPRGWFSDFYSWRAPHTSLFFDLWGNHCYKFPTVVLVGFQSLGLGYRKWIMDARHSKPEWSPGILKAVALCSPCCRVISMAWNRDHITCLYCLLAAYLSMFLGEFPFSPWMISCLDGRIPLFV